MCYLPGNPLNVAKKHFSDRTWGLEAGGVKSGFLKNGDTRGGSLLQHFPYNIVTCHILTVNE